MNLEQSPTDKIQDALLRSSKDFADATWAWAGWEAQNGFPHEGPRTLLHKLLRDSSETMAVNSMRHQHFVCTLIAISRMMDKAGRADSNRLSIPRIFRLIDEEELFEKRTQDVDGQGIVRATNVEVRASVRSFDRLKGWWPNDGVGKHSWVAINPKLKALRDNWFAHSLEGAPESEVNPYLIRDSLVLCGITIHLLRLHLFGTYWDPKDLWRQSFKSWTRFWDTHTEGLRQGPSLPT